MALSVVLWAYGCQSKVKSIIHNPTSVTRDELTVEVESFLATAKLRYAALDRQDEFKAFVFNTALDFMKGGSLNPIAVLMTAGNLAGIGAVISNVRKDTKVKSLKTEVETLSKALTKANG